MSYDIIKNIKIRDNKVFITSASNNVYPRTPHEHESSYCTKILQEQGEEAFDIDILKAYQSGNFQGGSNKYTRALKVLRHMPEYKAFDWRQDDWDTYKKNMAEREPEFNALLLKALKTRLPKDKFVIVKPKYEGDLVYYKSRKGASFCRWYDDKAKATLFSFMEDALSTIKNYTNNDNWYVMKLQ